MTGHLLHFSEKVSHLWFYGLSSNTSHDLILICLLVAGICFLKTCLSVIMATRYENVNIRKRKLTSSTLARVMYHMIGSVILVLECTLGYILMLGFMLGNLWLCLVIIFSLTASYFITYWSRISLPKSSHPHRNDTDEGAVFIPRSKDSDGGMNKQKISSKLYGENRRTIECGQNIPLLSFQNANDTQIGLQDELPPPSSQVLPQDSGDNGGESHDDNLSIHSNCSADNKNEGALATPRPSVESNTILDKYPVLRFHNVDIKDTSPSHASQSAIEIDELDRLVKELQD